MAGPEIVTATPADTEAIAALDESVRAATGHPALGDAVRRDIQQPKPDSIGFLARRGARAVAYLHVARSDTFTPQHWVLGLSRAPGESLDKESSLLLEAGERHISERGGGKAIVWIFDPSPADDALVEANHFEWQRDLYQMRVTLPLAETAVFPADVEIRAFEPGRDEAAWVDVNNRAFANHPEQGGWIAATLQRRMEEPWFDPKLFLLAFSEQSFSDQAQDGRMLVGFNWMKVHETDGRDPRLGEIFVIGVDPSQQGRGLGRALAVEGLSRLAAIGITTGMLFVAAENAGALALYRALGFTVHRIDRAYAKIVSSR